MPVLAKLFEEFPPVTTQEWIEKIIADLRGDELRRRLVWRTDEGLKLMPFYRREDIQNFPHIISLPGDFPWVRGSKTDSNNWLVRQNIEVDNYKESNKKALNILGKGVDSLGFIIKNPDAITCSNIENLLEGISYEKTEINFVSEGKGRETVEIILKLLEEKNINPFLFRGAFEADPLGRLMINGKLCTTVEKGYDYLAELFRLASPLKSFRLVQVNASHFSNAGADIVTELAYSISKGIHRAFTQTHSMKHWHCRQISQQE